MSNIDQLARLVEPGQFIELFEINASALGMVENLYLHPYIQLGTGTLSFNSVVYQPFPIRGEGWDWNAQGTLPRPKIMIANLSSNGEKGSTTALLKAYKDFVGAKFTRRTTYLEYLDGQPGANGTQQYAADIFTVERKVRETNINVEFELASDFDCEGVVLPRRQILAGYCPWIYRGTECGYTGEPKSDIDDNPITGATSNVPVVYNPVTAYAIDKWVYTLTPTNLKVYYVSKVVGNNFPLWNATKWVRDACPKTLRACKSRFGATAPLPYGGFPGASRLPNPG